MADSLGLQGELAIEIAAPRSKARLAPEEKARLGRKPTNNPDAYVLYLKAREQARIAASKQEAIAADQVFDRAIALDPAFAPAYARASIVNTKMFRLGQEPARKAKAQAQRDRTATRAGSRGKPSRARQVSLFCRGEVGRSAAGVFARKCGFAYRFGYSRVIGHDLSARGSVVGGDRCFRSRAGTGSEPRPSRRSLACFCMTGMERRRDLITSFKSQLQRTKMNKPLSLRTDLTCASSFFGSHPFFCNAGYLFPLVGSESLHHL